MSSPLLTRTRPARPEGRSGSAAAGSGLDSRRRTARVDERAASALAETFRVLGDPTRVRILDAISGGEVCVSGIATVVGLSESAVSHQLRLLRGLRVVRARRQGRMVIYALDDHHIKDLFAQGLRHVQEPAAPPSPADEASGLTVVRP